MLLLLIPLVFLGLLYVVAVLPQQRRVRAHDDLVRSLEIGQEVMTTSGVYGRLVGMSDETVQLEISPGVEIKIARASVGLVVAEDRPEAAETRSDADTVADRSTPGGELS